MYTVNEKEVLYLDFINTSKSSFFFKDKILKKTVILQVSISIKLNPWIAATETIFLVCCTQHCCQTTASCYIVSQDVLTLHCELHVPMGGACSILSCARVAPRMTKLRWGDFYWTCVHIITQQINTINKSDVMWWQIPIKACSIYLHRKCSDTFITLYNLYSSMLQ